MATKLNEQNTAWKALEPYAQLIKSLMPRADALHVFDSAGMLRWTTESMTGPDLPEAVTLVQKEAQADATLVGRVLYIAGEDYPVYVWWLRDEAQRLIASVAITTRKLVEGDGATFDRVHAFVKPAIECLRRELVAQSSILDLHHSISARDEDMALLLSVTDRAEQGTADHVEGLKSLLQTAAAHMKCALAALIVPERNVALIRPAPGRSADGSLLARTHRQLLQLAQTRREAVIINRVQGDKGQMPWRVLCCPLKSATGRVTGVLALFRDPDAPEFVEREARLIEAIASRAAATVEASYDALTGLMTRAALEHRVRAVLGEPGRRPDWSVLFVDFDQLHVLNENFGMHVGDNLLTQLGEQIRAQLPPGGLAARIAGDHFLIVVPGRREEAARFGETLRERAEQLGSLHGNARLHVSVTVGVTALEGGAEGLPHAISEAESACKAGKDRGRNRVEIYADADVSIVRRYTDITTAGDLRAAIAANRLRLDAQLIQPIGKAGHEPVTHYELLLRMIAPDGETVGPDRFLSAARRYQIMPDVDRWVIDHAIAQLKPYASWLADRPVVFSINFSGQSLGDKDFQQFLLDRIEASKLPPNVFCFELTESDAVANIASAEVLMRALRRIGCEVALDDFGTGLSSLAYLRSMPVTMLKIDGSFIRDILRDPRTESMVQAIAQLARTMSIATVAEYVETDEICGRLVELGVDFGQGFAIGRPGPLELLLEELPLMASAATARSGTFDALQALSKLALR
ncbi:MAG: bifunctional diguanylate cyclase/phosphodiesterase [Steroidobacteraceae bacterium]